MLTYNLVTGNGTVATASDAASADVSIRGQRIVPLGTIYLAKNTLTPTASTCFRRR